MSELYVAASGSLLNGFKLYGPFESVEAAIAWCEQQGPFHGTWLVLPVKSSLDGIPVDEVEKQKEPPRCIRGGS